MRVLAILGGLLVGLVGLFMSVCGGGLLVSLGYRVLRGLFDAQPRTNAFSGLFLLLVPAGSLALGIFVCRTAYQILRRNLEDE
jgi:cell division protein FtsX